MSAGTRLRTCLNDEPGREPGRDIANTMCASLCGSGKLENAMKPILCAKTKAEECAGAACVTRTRLLSQWFSRKPGSTYPSPYPFMAPLHQQMEPTDALQSQ